MAKKLASDMNVYYGSYNFGTATTSVSVALEAKSLDPTALTDTAERVLGGIRGDAITWGGLFDDAASVDAAGSALLATGTGVFSVLIGTGTGSRAYAGTAYLLAAKPVSNIGDLVKMEVAMTPDQGFSVGVHYGPAISKPSSAQVTSGTLDNAALTTAGGVGYIHVFTVSSGTINANLQESSTGTAWTSIVSGTMLATGGTSARLPLTGTIQRYTRFSMDGTGIGTAMGILSRS